MPVTKVEDRKEECRNYNSLSGCSMYGHSCNYPQGCDGDFPKYDELKVTLIRRQWDIVLEFFENMPYEDEWGNDGKLKDKELEGIRQELMKVSSREVK